MRDVVWADEALDDMDALTAYIATRNPAAASRVVDRIDETVDNLSHNPTGHEGVSMILTKSLSGACPYIIACALQALPDGGERIVIPHVIHGARDWPPGKWPE